MADLIKTILKKEVEGRLKKLKKITRKLDKIRNEKEEISNDFLKVAELLEKKRIDVKDARISIARIQKAADEFIHKNKEKERELLRLQKKEIENLNKLLENLSKLK